MTRTITHLYDSFAEARRAVELLERSGTSQADISILGGDPGTRPAVATAESSPAGTATGAGASLGTMLGGGAGLLAGLGALAIPGVGPVVAAGWLVATLTGAGAGAAAGGLLGSLVGAGTAEEHAHVYGEGLRRGGTLVSVRVAEADAERVQRLLDDTARVDPVERGAAYRSEDWRGFEPDAAAVGEPHPAAGDLDPLSVEIDRARSGSHV